MVMHYLWSCTLCCAQHKVRRAPVHQAQRGPLSPLRTALRVSRYVLHDHVRDGRRPHYSYRSGVLAKKPAVSFVSPVISIFPM